MWQTYGQALFYALAFSGVAFGIARLVVVVGERMIEQKHGSLGVRDMLVRRARLEQGLEARREERRKEIKAVHDATSEVARRRGQLERQVADLLRSGERVVHLIGEEVKGLHCFHAQVLNKYVGSAAQTQHAFIDARWAQPQDMEIWAPALADARKMIEARYPPAFGYHIVSLFEVGTPAAGEGKAA
ncbi:hypothetical protein [Azospirillum sp. TSO22-1]|uniref:hypothetical protein n=1 Tax=Azospirillum sp. TSO22-1 TaxID=716789 RepID=UPI000D60BD02|nr:hypothetical protein [Azospirillum sp. TSO22-1]PWC56137.1 hypothetical protein TSO221_02525 [Azospirillum sp. TSO22-1]